MTGCIGIGVRHGSFRIDRLKEYLGTRTTDIGAPSPGYFGTVESLRGYFAQHAKMATIRRTG